MSNKEYSFATGNTKAVGASPAPWLLKLREIWILFRIQFAEVRDEWVWIVLMASMFPFTTLLFLKYFSPVQTPEVMVRIITGNMVFALTIMGVNVLGQVIAEQKKQGHFLYYAALPVSKLNFVFALFVRGLLTCIPSVVILAVLGQWIYGLTFVYSIGMIPVFLISLLACVGMGTMIGFLSPSPQLASLLAQSLMMVINFLTPVLVTVEMLPAVLQKTAYLFPTTYVAEAFRIIVTDGWTMDVARNMLILTGFIGICLYLLARKMDWRIDG
ncbi:ABC transporter permease [Dethiobacter alkaliphilus]|uniref:ABC transporter permease n=1 Tax=Dethiobacter alkaliphilus TaxID=427926 RepID=UPI0022279DA2|nr:ABC transporter permease [Dethiobacter alkaliphilus]MCW3490598.1 ABC transporter permease [Dethiobacter alkaliphilus]